MAGIAWELTRQGEIHRAQREYPCAGCGLAINRRQLHFEDRIGVNPYKGGPRYHFECAEKKEWVRLVKSGNISLADRPEETRGVGRKIRRYVPSL